MSNLFYANDVNNQALEVLWRTDGYKLDHVNTYPENTEMVYSNFTPRSIYRGETKEIPPVIVMFGLKRFLDDFVSAWDVFFESDIDVVASAYKARVEAFSGAEDFNVDHIYKLHELGYLPLQIKAIPEGALGLIGQPVITVRNTDPSAYWLVNYIETWLSTAMWHPITAATVAWSIRRMMDSWSLRTGGDPALNGFQAHDFSYRGMTGWQAATVSGMGHALSFTGSDSLSIWDAILTAYPDTTGMITGGVPACYDDKTEILTDSGWKLFEFLSKEDKVAQYHENGTIDFVIPKEYFKDRYKGEMVHFSSSSVKNMDAMVTPNHKMVQRQKSGKVNLFETGDTRQGQDYVVGAESSVVGSGFSAVDRLKVAFQADGAFASGRDRYDGSNGGSKTPIRFSFKKDRKIQRMREILAETGYDYNENYHPSRGGYTYFWVKPDEEFFKDFSWIEIGNISSTWAKEFVEELALWDGTRYKSGRDRNSIKYSTSVKECADIVEAIVFLAGYRSNMSIVVDKRGDRKDNYNVSITYRDFIGSQGISKTKIDYDGYVYCVSVPTKMIVVRRNGSPLVCGNTEHAVMTANAEPGEDGMDESATIRRLLDIHPTGILSVVSDSYDYWKMLTETLPAFKKDIMERDGKYVVRPDSGDPVKIVTGDPDAPEGSPARKGSLQVLWEEFGGTVNEAGYLELDSHVGMIYGDSMNFNTIDRMCRRMEETGFATSNIVFGLGSYSYQGAIVTEDHGHIGITRDTFGFAYKATAVRINGQLKEIFKDPKTGNGNKKSARGFLRVVDDGSDRELVQGVSEADEQNEQNDDMLRTVFLNGNIVNMDTDFQVVRERLVESTADAVERGWL